MEVLGLSSEDTPITVDILRRLFEQADIEINGSRPWDIQVHERRWYKRVIQDKNLGLGESYVDGWWDCQRLDEMICRILRSGLEDKVRGNFKYLLRLLPAVLFNLQSKRRARMIADRHYDLGNDLFFAFLDPYRQYSCAYFKGTDDLARAQQNKLALIAEKLNLSAMDRVLDIGCGWGGLARYIAEQFGCAVTAVNISGEQLRFAASWCKGLPIQFRLCDYRAIEGRYDKIVSVGMFEHVGCKNYRTFMKTVNRCLNGYGSFLLHTIGGNTSRTGCDPWITRYIFPNSMLPSTGQVARAAEQLFVIEDWHNLAPHYDRTLMAWNDNFQRSWPRLRTTYDARFKRMWEYYLLSCAGAFRARSIQVWQILMTPHGSGRSRPPQRR